MFDHTPFLLLVLSLGGLATAAIVAARQVRAARQRREDDAALEARKARDRQRKQEGGDRP